MTGLDQLADVFARGMAAFEAANPLFEIDEFACKVCEVGPGEKCEFDALTLPGQTFHLSRLRVLEDALLARYAAAIEAGDLAVCAVVRGVAAKGARQ